MVQNRATKSPKITYIVAFWWVSICTIGPGDNKCLLGTGLDEKSGRSCNYIVHEFMEHLTGINVYDDIGRVGGAGASIPVTGFANSIVSPAMEYKKEGYVMGVGARMFLIAGPVLVYGIITSIVVGIIYYIIK